MFRESAGQTISIGGVRAGKGKLALLSGMRKCSCLPAPEMIEKVGHRLNVNARGGFRPVHERTEVLQIAGEKMACPACGRGLKDGPVLLRKAGRAHVGGGTFDEPDRLEQRIQAVKDSGNFRARLRRASSRA